MRTSEKIYELFLTLEQNTVLTSIRQGFLIMMPVFLTGAVSLLMLNLPIPVINNYIHTIWNGRLAEFFNLVYESTFGLSSVFVLFTVSFTYSSNITREVGIINILSCLVSVASYIAILGIKPIINIGNVDIQAILLPGLHVQSIFIALLCSLTATRIFLFLTAKISFIRHYTQFSIDADYRSALHSLLAMIITISLFTIVSLSVTSFFDVTNLNELIMGFLVSPFEKLGRSLSSGLLILFMQSLFWFFGIHGSNMFEPVNLNFFSVMEEEIINKTFFDVFAFAGGCGTSLSLLIAIFLFSKLKVQKSLCKFALLPMCFNINEIIVFGLPIILNPLMLIPFILTPMVTLSVSYIAMTCGLVPETVNSVSWTTPVLISGFIATGSIRGTILQIVTITIGVFIYAPFVKIGNKIYNLKTDNLIDQMSDLVKDSMDKGSATDLFKRNDFLSKAAKELAFALRKSIENKEIELYYQPQHDNSGHIVSCEALLRWKFLNRQYIFPPLVLEIAKEDNSYSYLTDCIIDKAIADTRLINSKFGDEISVSINIDSSQLNNLDLINKIIKTVNKSEIIKNTFGIEITEESELKDNGHLEEAFVLLHENGIKLAIDDFSTGHTSIVYLQSNKFDFVKLDGSLVRNLLENERSLDIIKSITELGKSLGFEVIAEYVENEKQKKILQEIGCSKYQGYFYSPPLTLEDFIEYTEKCKLFHRN